MKRIASIRRIALVAAACTAASGVAFYAGRHVARAGAASAPHPQSQSVSQTLLAPRKAWICPMHPHIVQDHPGTCPICGMDLVETGAGHSHDEGGVQVDAVMRQRMGVRLAAVARRHLAGEIRGYGNVAIDEASRIDISPKIEGWVRKLHVQAVGQQVRAGDVLYEIYSPELVQREREYIELLQRRDQMLESLAERTGQNAQLAASLARERLRLRDKFRYADVGDDVVDRIEKYRRTVEVVPVRAPRSGFVTRIGAREGGYVTPMTNVLSLADTTKVWIDVALYPDEAARIAPGDEATVRLPGVASSVAKGRLRFATPVVDPATRTRLARLEVDNPGNRLRPGAIVDVVVAARPHEALTLPRSAVMRTGHGERVMLSRGDGRFLPVEVQTGIEAGELVEIIDGLQEGAQVAVNGQFLLDAAASLAQATQRMRDGR